MKVKDFSKEELTISWLLEYKVLRAQKSKNVMPTDKLTVLLLVKNRRKILFG